MESDWALGAATSGAQKRIEGLRSLSDDEVAAVRSACAITQSLNPNNLVRALVLSRGELADLADAGTEVARVSDGEYQHRLRTALDQWLMGYASLRQRIERQIGSLFGPTAETEAKEAFQRLYREDVSFRICWEWRNLAQHHFDPARLTRFHTDIADESYDIKWSLDSRKVQEVADRWPDAVREYAMSEPRVRDAVDSAMASFRRTLSHILLTNEVTIERSAALIEALCVEVLDSFDRTGVDEVAVVAFKLDRLDKSFEISTLPLRYDLVVGLRMALDDAREEFEQPRRWVKTYGLTYSLLGVM